MKVAVASIAFLTLIGSAAAQTLPDIENGRYSMSPVEGGVVRLDTRTGAVSTCGDKGNGWACTIVPDERAAYDTEIGRLLKDNAALKAELVQRDAAIAGKADEAKPDTPKLKSEGERKLEIPLPSDRDIDRALGFLESAWRKLMDIATRVQRDVNGRI